MARVKTSPIALDFGEHTVKAVQLERRGGVLKLRDARSVEVEAGREGGDSRQLRLVHAARKALRRGRFRGRSVITALRLSDVTTRHIRVPEEHREQYGQYLAGELRAQSGGGQLTFCALPITDLLEAGAQKREFLCCVADARVVEEQLRILEELRLDPVAIDLETCAQVRPFVEDAGQCSFLNLDLGHHSSRITIVKDGMPVIMRSVPVGGSEMAATLRTKLDLDLDAILDLAAGDGDHENLELTVTRALAEQLDLVLGRVADCVRYCGALFQGRAVSPLRVVGSFANLPGLAGYLGRRVGIKAEIGDPFGALGLPFVATDRHVNGGSFATVLGLALRGVSA